MILAALCVLMAFPFGRSVMRRAKGRERQSRMLGWALRTIITGAAVVWRGIDTISVTMFVLVLLAFGAGLVLERNENHEEHLEKVIFPNE